MTADELLKAAVEQGASDLHLKAGASPMVRIHGDLVPLADYPKLRQEDTAQMALSLMTESQRARFKEHSELDLAYSASGLGRFRVNVFQQRSAVGLVFRAVPTKVPTFEELTLPPVLTKLAEERRGLILVTGTTGSGKSTTLAAVIDHVNKARSEHIMTVEDPIEYLHRDAKSIVNQREVGSDTESFSTALRSALRQDPDVILVGEMRDFETISTALTAAETGHLVLSTLHTTDTMETVNRIIAVFPPYQQKQVRQQLGAVLRGVISQRLVPKADGKGRVPAVEVMIVTQTIRECIMDAEKTRKIPEYIAAGYTQYGMQTFDQSLYWLYQKQLITLDEAMKWASNPADFSLRVKGIQGTSEVAWEGGTGAPTIERFG